MILRKGKIWREGKKKSYVLAGKKSRKEKEMEGENFHENHHFSFLPNWEEMRK